MNNERRRVLIPVIIQHDVSLIVRGVRLLGWRDAVYVLLHVVELPLVTSPHVNELGKIMKRIEDLLKPTAETLKELGYEAEVKAVTSRDVVEGIMEELKLGNYTLVILHKKRRKTAEKFILAFRKSTSQRLIQKSSVPVMVIPVEEHP